MRHSSLGKNMQNDVMKAGNMFDPDIKMHTNIFMNGSHTYSSTCAAAPLASMRTWVGDNVSMGPNNGNWIGDFPPPGMIDPMQPGITIQPIPQKLFPIVPEVPYTLNPFVDTFPWTSLTTTTWPVAPSWRLTFSTDHITAAVDVPGVKVEDLSVTIENGVIKASGKRFDNGQAVELLQVIGVDYDPRSSEALLEAGVLTVTVRKFKDKVAHKVSVKTK